MSVNAAEDFQRLLNRQAAVPEAQKDQANGLLAVAHAYLGAIPEANDYVGRIGARQGAPHGPFVDMLYVAGVVDRFSGEWLRAVQRQSPEMLHSVGGSGRQEMHLLTEVGFCKLELGELVSVESSLTQAIERYRANQPPVTPRHTHALVGLARVHLARAAARAHAVLAAVGDAPPPP
ncbi:MAG: hypothetical protein OEW68_16670 [Gammaproteobacteria bacterium]|nr:hypothetical protein [Gammaproteobacteria bacterium]MDH4316452.1 hypothetical protein [Gammaproteobacteria bacterium]MDH5215669.1 hypothetical protein [Gammaproteobacteria bacterium]